MIRTALLLYAGFVSAFAQVAEPIPPVIRESGVAKAPDFSEWKVRYRWSDPTGRLPIEAEVVKNGKVRLERHRYSDGTVDEIWSFGGIAFLIPGGEGEVSIHSGGGPEFGAVDWIGERTLKGSDSLNGRPVRVYETVDNFSRPSSQGVPQPDQPAPAPEPVVMAKAWIDAETGLPLRIENALGVFDFEHRATTGQRLTLPPAIAAKIAEIERLTKWYDERNRRFRSP